MKTFFFALIVVIAALASVGFSEALVIAWLTNVPFDATGGFLAATLLPVQFILVGITTGLLMRVYAHKPFVFMPLYWLVYLVAHSFELHAFLNPVADILSYALIISLACGFWFFCLWRFYLKPQST